MNKKINSIINTFFFKPQKAIIFVVFNILFLILSNSLFSQTLTQSFTSNGSFSVPKGVTQITVECWGAGGRGATMTSNGRGGGGGGGAYARSVISVTPETSYNVTIGAGGSGATLNGGNTIFGSNVVVAAGGAGVANNTPSGAAGGTLIGSIGDVTFAGGAGGDAVNSGSVATGGGGGGAGSSGAGGNASGGTEGIGKTENGGNGGAGHNSNNTVGNNGVNYGGGGSGAKRNSGTNRNGGSGAPGLVRVTWLAPYYATFTAMDIGCSQWTVGEEREVSVTVTNNGQATWTNSNPDINIGVKWNADPDYLVRVHANGLTTGSSQTYTLTVTAPSTIGSNNLTFDVVVEGDCWFGNNSGSCGPGNSVYVSGAVTIENLNTGPGGVGTSSNNQLWLKPDFGLSYSNGASVNYWPDCSGNNNHASQTTASQRPTYNSNQLNGFSTVSFDGTDDILSIPNYVGTNNFTNFIITKTSVTHQIDAESTSGTLGTAGQRYVFGPDHRLTEGGAGVSIGTNGISVYEHGDSYMPALSVYNGSNGSSFNSICIKYNNKKPSIYKNSLLLHDGLTSTKTNVYNTTMIGGYMYGYYSGDIAEVIMYNNSLNDAQIIIVNNYLSAKYGLSLAANDVYSMDNIANGDYDYDVTGIGRVNASNIHCNARGNNLVWFINPKDLDDDEFLLWGHNNGIAEAKNTTDIPSGIEARFDRVWRVSEASSSGVAVDVGSISLKVDLSSFSSITVADLKLLVDVNNNGSFSDETPIGGAIDLGSGIYAFNNISNFTDQKRFTIATTNQTSLVINRGSTGPGGVGSSSSNNLWLKSDFGLNYSNGNSVNLWSDFSGNNNNATQATSAQRPLYIDNQLNTHPVIRFDGTDDFLGISNYVGTNNFTNFIISKTSETHEIDLEAISGTSGVSGQNYILGADHRVSDGGAGISIGTNGISVYEHGSGYMPALAVYNGSVGSDFNSICVRYNNKRPNIYKNLSLVSAGLTSTMSTIYNSTIIGSGNYGNFNGDIAEVIMYNYSLNDAQIIIVNNYLAAKYNIALEDDYVYTMGTSANGNYSNDVAGIGRVDVSNIHDNARGTGLVWILNPSDLNNDEFLMWGHDNGLLEATNITDVPAGVEARFERIWRVSEVNSTGTPVDIGSIDIRFDLNGLGTINTADLRLLIDTDNDNSFSNEISIDGAVDLGEGIYAFNGVSSITDKNRFTIATTDLDQTPLPIELISFTAKVIDNKVDLTWATSTEINNDYFSVEKSKDNNNFETIEKVDGAGNSFYTIVYKCIDSLPYNGVSYYRLKQTDYDGNESYSDVVSVNMDYEKLFILRFDKLFYDFENELIVAEITNSVPDNKVKVKVFNTTGGCLIDKDYFLLEGKSKILIPTNELPDGVYIVNIYDNRSFDSRKFAK